MEILFLLDLVLLVLLLWLLLTACVLSMLCLWLNLISSLLRVGGTLLARRAFLI